MDRRVSNTNAEVSKKISSSVQGELVEFIYSQLPITIIVELILVTFSAIALWPINNPLIMTGWLLYFVCISLTSSLSLFFSYKFYKNSLTVNAWIKIYTLVIILVGLFWGFMGGYLLPHKGIVHQSFVVFILLGITSGANSILSANRMVYAVFLFVSFFPLAIRLFFFSDLFILLGTSAIIYMLAMLAISANNYKLLKSSIMLRFENTDLDLINQRLKKNVLYQTTHDPLTQLPNRHLFYERIDHDLALANRFKSLLVVMYVDIDHFKDINETHGTHIGDIVLQVLAKRLLNCVRKSDTVARFGGVDFIVLIMTKNQETVNKLSNNILKEIALPITIGNETIQATASIGVCIYPNNGVDSDSLIRNAGLALYLAQKAHGNNFQIYTESASAKAKRHLQIQQQLLNIKSYNEFNLVYQPIIDSTTHKIVGAEALLRWSNPVLGEVFPEEFISIVEDTGSITALSEWIMLTACKQNKQWQLSGAPKIQVAVNISAMQLGSDDIKSSLSEVLSKTGLDPRYLMIELTETSLMDNSELVVQKLETISDLGIEISIDDFGTGYSSFRYLTEFPINRLKIDRSLIHNCNLHTKNRSVLHAIVTLSHQLNLLVVAEGIETEEQLAVVEESGCDELQGYYFSKPLSPSDFLALLIKNTNEHHKI